jgi:hypothetical protein
LVLLILERIENDPEALIEPVRSKVASPAERTDHEPARGASKPPLTTALELEEHEGALGVAVAVSVTVEAEREEQAAVSVVVVVDCSPGMVTVEAGREEQAAVSVVVA